MRVKDLIEELQKVDGDLKVYVFADHGQQTIQAGTFGVRYCYKEDSGLYTIEENFSKQDLIDEGEDLDHFDSFVEIGAL